MLLPPILGADATDTQMWGRQANQTSIRILNEARQNGEVGITEKQLIDLESDVLKGECALQRTPDGSLCRVVPMEVLRLHRQDETVLVCVGSWTQARGIQPKCLLPAEKRGFNEAPDKARERLVGELCGLWHASCDVTFKSTYSENETKSSPSLGLQTQYVRTIHNARLGAEKAELKKRKTRTRIASTASTTDCQMGKTYSEVEGSSSQAAMALFVGFKPKRESVRLSLKTLDINLPTYQVEVLESSKTIGGSRYDLYSWLPPDEFELFRRQEGKEAFESWVRSLKPQLEAFILGDIMEEP